MVIIYVNAMFFKKLTPQKLEQMKSSNVYDCSVEYDGMFKKQEKKTTLDLNYLSCWGINDCFMDGCVTKSRGENECAHKIIHEQKNEILRKPEVGSETRRFIFSGDLNKVH
jgi:hypothetical protein